MKLCEEMPKKRRSLFMTPQKTTPETRGSQGTSKTRAGNNTAMTITMPPSAAPVNRAGTSTDAHSVTNPTPHSSAPADPPPRAQQATRGHAEVLGGPSAQGTSDPTHHPLPSPRGHHASKSGGGFWGRGGEQGYCVQEPIITAVSYVLILFATRLHTLNSALNLGPTYYLVN